MRSVGLSPGPKGGAGFAARSGCDLIGALTGLPSTVSVLSTASCRNPAPRVAHCRRWWSCRRAGLMFSVGLRDTHVAAVVDGAGRLLGSESFAAQETGYRRMVAWFELRGRLVRAGWKALAATVPACSLSETSRWWRSTGRTVNYAARRAARPTACICVPNLVTGRSSVCGLTLARRSATKARPKP